MPRVSFVFFGILFHKNAIFFPLYLFYATSEISEIEIFVIFLQLEDALLILQELTLLKVVIEFHVF